MIKKLLLTGITLLSLAPSAFAGWYEIKNYEGKIGEAPVHVSLQTYGYINKGQPEEWLVEGSYYYDKHRIPIPLKGKRTSEGQMVLCEANMPKPGILSLVIPPPSDKNPIPCAIKIKIETNGANGEWNNGKRAYPISLKQVGSLDDTEYEKVKLKGVVEIPMWYHTKKYMLLGSYESQKDCPASMLRLKLVNIKTGAIDNEISLGCEAGMIMTTIYSNVLSASSERKVMVGFQGGRMGYDEEIIIERKHKVKK